MTGSAEYLQTPLQFLKGVGPRKAADFARVGLNTIEDLLYRFPLRYEDRGRLQSIASLREGQTVSTTGDVITCGLRGTRRPGMRIFEALLRDASGTLRLAWFNSAYLKDQIRPGSATDRLRHVRAQSVDRAADHEPAVRGRRARRCRDDP